MKIEILDIAMGDLQNGQWFGALKNQPQHLGEVKVLGWKKQKSCISS